MKAFKDIGSLYKEAFREYQPTPPPAAIEQIMAQPEVRQMAHWTVKWMQPVLWTAGAAMIAISAYLLWPNPESINPAPGTELAADTPAPVLSIPLDDEPALQEFEALGHPKEVIKEDPGSKIKPQDITEKIAQSPDPKVLENTTVDKTAAKQDAPAVIPVKTPVAKAEKTVPDTPVSAMDRHRLQRPPRDTTPLPGVVMSETQYICKGENVVIGASGGIAYVWNTGEKAQTITVRPLTSSLYKVTVTRPDKRKVSGEIWVNVEDCATLYVPNAFTPNNDGLNDIFITYGKKLNSFHIQIYNETGEILFESTNIEEGWDGTFQGNNVETGNYFYRIVYYDSQNNKQTRNGRITLLR